MLRCSVECPAPALNYGGLPARAPQWKRGLSGAGPFALSDGHAFYLLPCSKPSFDIELREDVAHNDGGLDHPRRQHDLQLRPIDQSSPHQNAVQEKFPQKLGMVLDYFPRPQTRASLSQ